MFRAVNARATADTGGLASTEVQEQQMTDLYLRALGHIRVQELQAAQVQATWSRATPVVRRLLLVLRTSAAPCP